MSIGLALCAYAPALDNFFIADDFNWLYEAGFTPRNPAHIFSLVIANFFRPVVHVWFALLRPLFGLHAAPYYAAAIVLHGLNGGVVAWGVARLTRERAAGVVAGLFFVLHFTHFDAVYWLSAVSDLLGTTFTIAAVVAAAEAARGRPRAGWIALGLTPLVLMCKESMVAVLPLLAWTAWCFAPDRGAFVRALRWGLPAAGIWVGYLLLQRSFQATSPHIVSGYYGLGSHPPRMLLNAVGNLLVPNRYVVPVPWWAAGLLVAGMVGAGVAVTRRLREGDGRFALFCLGWIVLAFLPCAFFRNYDRIPSRYSYLPSVAAAALVGWWAAAWAARGMTRRSRMLTLAAVVGFALSNIAYLWRIDRVRYQGSSDISRALADVLQRDREAITHAWSTEPAALVLWDTPLPLGVPHAGAAAALYTGILPADVRVVKPGEGPGAHIPEAEAGQYRWSAEREVFQHLSEAAVR